MGTTPPKLYLGSFLHSNSSFHPYIHNQTANRTRSFDGETSRSASGSCGAIPLPEGGQGVIEQCTKDQNALWTVCNIGCGATTGHLWSTTRDGNRPYRFFLTFSLFSYIWLDKIAAFEVNLKCQLRIQISPKNYLIQRSSQIGFSAQMSAALKSVLNAI